MGVTTKHAHAVCCAVPSSHPQSLRQRTQYNRRRRLRAHSEPLTSLVFLSLDALLTRMGLPYSLTMLRTLMDCRPKQQHRTVHRTSQHDTVNTNGRQARRCSLGGRTEALQGQFPVRAWQHVTRVHVPCWACCRSAPGCAAAAPHLRRPTPHPTSLSPAPTGWLRRRAVTTPSDPLLPLALAPTPSATP